MYLLECVNLKKKNVFNYINIKVLKNKVTYLLGNNEELDNTLIKLLNGLDTYDDGKIMINGYPLDDSYKDKISYLPRINYLDDLMSVNNYIKFFNDFYEDFDYSLCIKLLKRFNIDSKKKIYKLSYSDQRKIMLFLVISRKAKLYIIDHPFIDIDNKDKNELLDLIFKTIGNKNVIILSDNIKEVQKYVNSIILFDSNKVILSSNLDSLTKDEWELINKIEEVKNVSKINQI